MRKALSIILTFLFLFSIVGVASAATLNVPGNYKTIQGAINAARTGNEKFCSGICSIKYCIQNGIWYQRVKLRGYSPAYCKKFNHDLKLRVRAFFNYTCFLCGKSETENGKKPSVHHVIYDKMICCNDKPVKLVPLCSSCHPKTNANRKYWENLIESELDEKYNSKCYFTKKEFSIIESDNYINDVLYTSMNT
jgi:hypothetical protein